MSTISLCVSVVSLPISARTAADCRNSASVRRTSRTNACRCFTSDVMISRVRGSRVRCITFSASVVTSSALLRIMADGSGAWIIVYSMPSDERQISNAGKRPGRAIRTAHSAHRRRGVLHGDARRHDRHDVAAGDRAKLRRIRARADLDHHRLPGGDGRVHSHRRLGERALRRAQPVRGGDRGVHARVAGLRRGALLHRAANRAPGAGHRRGVHVAGGAPGGAAPDARRTRSSAPSGSSSGRG